MSPPVATLALLALAGLGCRRPPERHSALLVTLDTTRADALSCYGNPERTTPELERLAAEGLCFDGAHTSAPLTLPAHASMLTGLAPPRHGLRVNGEQALAEEATTLAERAREAGIDAAAFVSAGVLGAAFGLGQGFEPYSVPDPPRAARRGHGAERPAAETVGEALAWLAARDTDRPFFLWVHLYDAHAPHVAPAPFAARFSTPYLGEVASMDRELGRLLAALRANGRERSTFVLVVGDHGEAFGEHGEVEHGLDVFETTLRVPLVGRWPDDDRRRPAGTRSDELVGVIDVAPTLAEALGLAPLPDVDGLSFYSGPLPASRGLWFESYQGYLERGAAPLAGWMDTRGKYLHGSPPTWFDWRADPGETRDLLADHARDAELFRAEMRRLLAAPALTPHEPGDPEARAEVEALGYGGAAGPLESFPDPLAPSAAPRAGPRDGD